MANTFLAKRLEQGIEFNEVGTVDRDQLIAGLHSGFGPRAIGDDLSDHRFGIDVLPDQAQISGKRWRSLADVLTIDDGNQSVWRMELPIQTDPTGHTRWKPLGYFRPVCPAIGGAENPAPFAPFANRVVAVDSVGFGDSPWPGVKAVAHAVPHSHDNRVRIGRTHRHIDHAGLVIDKEALLPGLSTIGGLVDASLWVVAIEPSSGTDIDGIGVLWVYQNPGDLIGTVQA